MRFGIDPSGPQARQWVLEELGKDDYHDGRSIFERIMRWLGEQFARLQPQQPDNPDIGVPPIVVALIALVIVGVLGWLLTKLRAERRTAAETEAVLGDSTLTSTQFRDRGAAALREGRYAEAVVHYTRAMARESADRTLLTDAPSLTAHEIGQQLTVVFPEHAAPVARSMDLFDAVRYGRYAASRVDAEAVRDTADALVDTKPRLPDRLTPEARVGATPAPGESVVLAAFEDRS